jgi:hypothetical protein
MSCDEAHQKRRLKLLVKFGNAEPGTIVKAELCPSCGVYVKAKQLGCNDEGFYLIPSALAKVVEDVQIGKRRQPKNLARMQQQSHFPASMLATYLSLV